MLLFDLSSIFKARNVTKPYSFLVQSGFTPKTATLITSGEKITFSAHQLELLCRALYCTPNDLYIWQDATDHPIDTGHPLCALKGIEADAAALLGDLQRLSPSDLSALAKKLRGG